MQNQREKIKQLNANTLPFITMMGGQIVALGNDSCTFEFDIGTDFCHSINIVQGGFTTAMLDAAMAHAVMFGNDEGASVASFEIKTNYLDVTRAGKLRVEGWILKRSYRTVFLEGRVYNAEGVLTATASSVGKLIKPA